MEFLVYLWLIIPNFAWIPAIASIFLMMVGFVLLFFGLVLIGNEEDAKKFKEILKNLKIYIIISIIVIITNSFIPDRNGLLLLYSTPKIVELSKSVADNNRSKQLIRILDNSLEILENKTKNLKDK